MASPLSLFAGLGRALGSPAASSMLGLGATALAGIQQGVGGLFARIANERRYAEGMDLLRDRATASNTAMSQLSSGLLGGYGGRPGEIFSAYKGLYDPILDSMSGLNQSLASQYGALSSGVLGGLNARLNTAMGMLEGAGAQERVDINRAFDASRASAMADLTNRGFVASTLAPQVSAISDRSRADALGGLNERLLQQRTGLFTGLSGDILNAQQSLGLGGINLQSSLAGNLFNARTGFGETALGQYFGARNAGLMAQERLGILPLQNFLQTSGDIANWIGGRQDIPPDPSVLYGMASMLGAGSVQGPQAPSFDWFSPTVGAIGNTAGLAALGAFLR